MPFEKYSAEEFAAEESFQNYVFGKKEKDKVYWENWIALHPEKIREINEAKKLISSLRFNTSNLHSKKEQDRKTLYSSISNTRNGKKQIYIPQRSWTRSWQKVAAVILIFLLAGFSTWYIFINRANVEQPLASNQIIEKSTPKGVKQTIQLVDGTIVKLNSESSIRYEESFDGKTREVYLTGEAYFEVAKDSLKPFIVRSGSIETIVLGTSFNVSAYPEDGEIKVALVEGRVQVRNAANSDIGSRDLFPSEMLSVSRKSGAFNISGFDAKEITGWRNGLLYFKEADFPEIVEKLERWYNVEFEVKGQVENKAFSGEFENKSLDIVLDGIGFSLHFDHEIKGKKVIIKSHVSP